MTITIEDDPREVRLRELERQVVEASCHLRNVERQQWVQSEVGTSTQVHNAMADLRKAKIAWLNAVDNLIAARGESSTPSATTS